MSKILDDIIMKAMWDFICLLVIKKYNCPEGIIPATS